MAKQIVKVAPSSTEVSVEITIPDSLPISQSGGTPIDPTPINLPPIVNAGTDQSVTLPVSGVILNGTGLDPDGSVTGVLWEKVSGPNATIINPNVLVTQVTGMVAGNYVFRLTLTDDKQTIASDSIAIEVKPAVVVPPVVLNGKPTKGGDGYPEVYVTTLNPTGAGSLTSVWGSKRRIVFNVQGTIRGFQMPNAVSEMTLNETGANITFVGDGSNQTGFQFDGSDFHDIILKNFRVRDYGNAQSNNSGDGIQITNGAYNFWLTKISSSLNRDGNIDATDGAHDILIEDCIIGGGAANNAPDYSGSMLLAYAGLKNVFVRRCLFVPKTPGGVGERCPYAHSNGSFNLASLMFSFENNVVAEWTQYGSGFGYNASGRFINNWYSSKTNPDRALDPKADPSGGNGSKVYIAGNVSANNASFPGSTNGATLNTWPIPAWAADYNIMSGGTVPSYVKANAGCFPIDSIDQALINSVSWPGGVTPPTNNPPGANAGIDQDLPIGTTAASLSGSATDNDGTVASTVWSKVSGSGTITNPNSLSTGITGMTSGSSVFRLTVTDDKGATAVDNVTISIGAVTPPPTTGYTLVYETGYDDVDSIDPFDHGQWGSGTQASHLSTTIKKSGAGSFKSGPLANVSSGTRSEVQYESAQTPLEGILEYDVYYDNFFANDGHSLQWHPSTGGGSGTGLYHKGGKLQFVTVKSGISGTNVGTPFAVSTKVWHHMKLTYKFGNSGYIKVEMDGVEKVNANVQMGDGSRPYLKVGVNVWTNQTSIVYYDNLSVWKKN